MQPSTSIAPATAPLTEIGTGTAGANPSTASEQSPEQLLEAFTRACIANLEAEAAHHRAEETVHRTRAQAHRVDPYLSQADRVLLAAAAEHQALGAAELADRAQRRANAMRLEAGITAEPLAVITITVQRDRIQETARLFMGGTHQASRSWERVGSHSWRSRDAEWSAHEDRIGVELVEWMEALSFPERLANLMPRPARKSAALEAAREVAHG